MLRDALDHVVAAGGLSYILRAGVVFVSTSEEIEIIRHGSEELVIGSIDTDEERTNYERLLQKRVTLNVRDSSLPDIIENLRAQTDVNIFIGATSIPELDKIRVSIQASEIRLGSALLLILTPLDLHCDLEGIIVKITYLELI